MLYIYFYMCSTRANRPLALPTMLVIAGRPPRLDFLAVVLLACGGWQYPLTCVGGPARGGSSGLEVRHMHATPSIMSPCEGAGVLFPRGPLVLRGGGEGENEVGSKPGVDALPLAAARARPLQGGGMGGAVLSSAAKLNNKIVELAKAANAAALCKLIKERHHEFNSVNLVTAWRALVQMLLPDSQTGHVPHGVGVTIVGSGDSVDNVTWGKVYIYIYIHV